MNEIVSIEIIRYLITIIADRIRVMNIVIIGYGKMGKAVEQLARSRGHIISGIIDRHLMSSERALILKQGDVAIEFSNPESAFQNISEAITEEIPVISGTTGWTDHLNEITSLVQKKNGAFLYASNFSLGVNILFAINERLARIMNHHTQYDVSMVESHHIHKKDAPSGTALTLAEQIIENLDRKKEWNLSPAQDDTLHINSIRAGEVFGMHEVRYTSDIDRLSIAHEAFSRNGFALGAVLAAEWLYGRHGVYSMKDMLGL